jgi:hypothetical protein
MSNSPYRSADRDRDQLLATNLAAGVRVRLAPKTPTGTVAPDQAA